MDNVNYISDAGFVDTYLDALTYLMRKTNESVGNQAWGCYMVANAPTGYIRVDELLKLRYDEITGKQYLGERNEIQRAVERHEFAAVEYHLRHLRADSEVPVMTPELYCWGLNPSSSPMFHT